MKKIAEMTVDELFELQTELRMAKDEEKGISLPALLNVEEELFKKTSQSKSIVFTYNVEEIRAGLVDLLIHNGPYMKSVYQRDDVSEEKALHQALKYDRGNPYAYYRLGHLSYKKQHHLTAAVHFNNALRSDERRKGSYRLTEIEREKGHLYVSTCAMHVAVQSMEALGEPIDAISVKIQENEARLETLACQLTTANKTWMGSVKECEEKLHAEENANTLILYFSDKEQKVYYQGQVASLSINQGKMLKKFLLDSDQERPLSKHDFASLFSSRDEAGEIPDPIFEKSINRLERKLAQCSLPGLEEVENGYFYNGEIPYLVMEFTN